MKVVFLDRDGVINEDRPDYVKSWEEFSFIPGAKEAIKTLSEAKYVIIIVTNQASVGKGIVSKIAVEEINRRMVGEIGEFGGKIQAVYFCPHKPEDNCQCRKPKTGLFKEAIKRFKINPKQSFVIGDSSRDIEAGKKIGCRTILIVDGRISEEEIVKLKPKFTASNLKEAVVFILEPKKAPVPEKPKKRERKKKRR